MSIVRRSILSTSVVFMFLYLHCKIFVIIINFERYSLLAHPHLTSLISFGIKSTPNSTVLHHKLTVARRFKKLHVSQISTFNYHVYKRQPLGPILRYLKEVHIVISCLFIICFANHEFHLEPYTAIYIAKVLHSTVKEKIRREVNYKQSRKPTIRNN
jgi:hypothetical protein